ncbi:hypothetical protein F4811DRAFT_565826 [Daldinia bambusicola]|nr:hypothetical protein F4811DRAFT_565826 [Daldinia bambusicola]
MAPYKLKSLITRFRPLASSIALFIIVAYVYLLDWIKAHDGGWLGGFCFWFNGELLKTSWLPDVLYQSPHHQLAIAASIVDIAVRYIAMEKNFWQHWALVTLFVPAFTLTTTAFLYNFIEHGMTGRLSLYSLYQTASPTKYHHYGFMWLDFESWSCGVASLNLELRSVEYTWTDNCYRSQLARKLLLPSWLILCATILVSWFSFRGVLGWRGRLGDEDEVEGGEGRARLP